MESDVCRWRVLGVAHRPAALVSQWGRTLEDDSAAARIMSY